MHISPHNDGPEITPEQVEKALGEQRQGQTHARIAAGLDVDRTTVTRALGRHDRRLKKRQIDGKAKQVDRLEYSYSELVTRWLQFREASVAGRARTTLADTRLVLGLNASKAAESWTVIPPKEEEKIPPHVVAAMLKAATVATGDEFDDPVD